MRKTFWQKTLAGKSRSVATREKWQDIKLKGKKVDEKRCGGREEPRDFTKPMHREKNRFIEQGHSLNLVKSLVRTLVVVS